MISAEGRFGSAHSPSPHSELQSPPVDRLQLSAFSGPVQQPSPQLSAEQSVGQLQMFSPGSQVGLMKHSGGHPVGQSDVHDRHSAPMQHPSPQVLAGQSAGQLQAFSDGDPTQIASPHCCARA